MCIVLLVFHRLVPLYTLISDMNKLLKRVLIITLSLLLVCALTVIVIDPFFHYHKPLFGLKAVLNEKEYQCIGTIRNFDYDAMIVGSSVAENYNNSWFDERFGCKSIKAIRSYGATSDLCYFVDEGFKNHELKYVFYNLDPSSLMSQPGTTFEETGCPMYLYDNNPLNDVEYLFNKDVLFERIPYMLAQSYLMDYDEGTSYNWGQWKVFDLAMCTGVYLRHPRIAPMNDIHKYDQELDFNLEKIGKMVSSHPDTVFYIFFPPYSMLWWDNIYREGDTEFYLYGMERAINTLSEYDNVRFYYFMNDRDVITNLESNYLDTLHFSPDINYYICECLVNEKGRVNSENSAEVMADMRSLAYEITDSLMEPYTGMIKELIE